MKKLILIPILGLMSCGVFVKDKVEIEKVVEDIVEDVLDEIIED